MPYKDVSELPEKVKNALPEAAQKLFLSVVNSALEQYKGDEAKAAATAWEAVKGKYRKDKDTGNWVLKENAQPKQNHLDISPQEAEGLAALVAFVAD